MFFAVIDLAIRVTGHRDGQRCRRDGLVTVRHVEGHRAEVGVEVGELVGGETHVGRADVGSACRGVAAEGEVRGRVQGGSHIAYLNRGHVVTRHGVLGAVVNGRAVMTLNGHRHVNWVDGLITVRHVETHLVLIIRVAEVSIAKTHVGRSGIRSRRLGSTRELDSSRRI